jgi:hypothetical protein
MMPESPYVATPTPSPGQARAARVPGRPRTPHTKRTLATVLRERGALSMPHAVEVALDICDALSIAHANGVVHGQLGLGCVRLAFTPERGPRDVEIFTLEVDAEDSLAVPVAPFLEPERPGFGRRVDQRSDVWALGALLHTMLTGVAPADASMGASAELLLESTPRSLAAVIESCLSGDPESRPAGADEIAERIASFATWPPDQFARIGARRGKRAAAERVKRQLERRGLGNLPSVLDKLDDAALARAQRPTTESLASLLHKNARRSTEAAMERLMTAVHEGTEEARVALAGRLPSLVDFDDEDEEVLPTVVKEEQVDEHRTSFAAVVSPLTAVPVVLDEPLLSTPPRAPAITRTAATASRAKLRAIATAAGAVLAIVVGAGSLGYTLSARATTTKTTTTTTTTEVPAATSAAAVRPAIPVVAASALPEAPAITPASLPEAKPLAP